jgi:hypothetical protein
VTTGKPVHVGPWVFAGGYGQIGVSDIGTPNATVDAGHGFLVGGGAVAGVDVPKLGAIDVERGDLWETNKTNWSWPLGSGTTGENTNHYSPWTQYSYRGIVIGDREVGGLYGCENDGQSCTLTVIYGRGWPKDFKITRGPVTVKPQLWYGWGGSLTLPKSWWPW